MKNLLILFMFIMIVSCKSYQIAEIEHFDPDFHIGNSAEQSITNGHEHIMCADLDFDNYACLRIDKVKELNRILNQYRRVPRRNKISTLVKDMEGER